MRKLHGLHGVRMTISTEDLQKLINIFSSSALFFACCSYVVLQSRDDVSNLVNVLMLQEDKPEEDGQGLIFGLQGLIKVT